jgi:hypothetical protein
LATSFRHPSKLVVDGGAFAARDSRCVLATRKTNDHRSIAADDNRPLADENENGMNAAGSVMKAAGERTKVGLMSASNFNARVAARRELLRYASGGGGLPSELYPMTAKNHRSRD